MAGWTAANLSRSKRRRDGQDKESDAGYEGDSDEQNRRVDGGSKKRKKSLRPAETAEAAIARLSSSYNAAMTAVGALHRASSAISKAKKITSTGKNGAAAAAADKQQKQQDDKGDHNEDSEEERIAQLYRVAKAARSALGEAILLDPLVTPYAPTWTETVEGLGNARGIGSRSSSRQTLTSAAHRSTVRDLAYLVLVNYGDLLTCGCCCTIPIVDKYKGLLDRGTVQALPALRIVGTGKEGNGDENTCRCCWGGETEENTRRLALVAYCDASELDKSDPTLWLKIACTARSLGRIVFRRRVKELDGDDADGFSDPSPTLFDYRRLERHALESGLAFLAPGVPPNRAITRALREWRAESESEVTQYPPVKRQDLETESLVIDLPRYSWSAAGRILMRVCKMGGAYVSIDHHGVSPSEQVDETNLFGSASISMRVSPILTLPSRVLGIICEYLENDEGAFSRDIVSFETTCRALSADLVSARAVAERSRHQIERRRTRHSLEDEKGDGIGTIISRIEDQGTTGKSTASEGNNNKNEEKERDEQPQPPEDKKKRTARSHRSSKRVLSQKITSGKNAERSAKRKSVEYCLVSAVFSCTTQHPIYDACLKNKSCWSSRSHTTQQEEESIATPPAPGSPAKIGKLNRAADTGSNFAPDIDSSLKAFLLTWSGRNSGASDILSRFLSHVSQHVVEVFSTEYGDSVALSSCLLECFGLVTKRSGCREVLAPSWYGNDAFRAGDSLTEIVEVVSVNLVNAELRLKRCERGTFGYHEFEDDATCLAYMIPELLGLIDCLVESKGDVAASGEIEDVTLILAIRCHWLAASFHLWLSRSASQLQEIREAETAALQNIDNAVECLEKLGESVVLSTPHLESPARSGRHWRALSSATLSSYKNELQASFVVSRARQRFHELRLNERFFSFVGATKTIDITERETDILLEISSELLGRYGVDYEGLGGKHDELVTDLFKYHDAEMQGLTSSFAATSNSASKHDNMKNIESSTQDWKGLWNVVALSPMQLANLIQSRGLCLVSILSICAQSRDDTFQVMTSLLSGLARAALDQYEHLLAQGRKDDKASQPSPSGRNTGDSSDDFFSDSDDDLLGGQSNNGPLDTRQGENALLAARLFIEKLAELVSTCSDADLVKDYATCVEFKMVMHQAITLSSGKHDSLPTQMQLLKSPPKLDALNSISQLCAALLLKVKGDDDVVRELSSTVFKSLIEVVVQLRRNFPTLVRSRKKGDQRLGRAKHQATCVTYASYVAAVASDITRLLSMNQSILYSDGGLQESYLITTITSLEPGSSSRDFSVIVQMGESLLWFWKYIINADVIDGSGDLSSQRPGAVPSSVVHRITARMLVVPIASSIIALCGAVGHGSRSSVAQQFLAMHLNEQDDQLAAMSDYCDTDDSANAWYSDENDENSSGSGDQGPDTRSSRCFLKMILQSVQCCGLVFGSINESLACSNEKSLFMSAFEDNGPLLPLVTVRTLTHFADMLLTVFGNDQADRRGALWSEEYPYSARSTGLQLDSLLHKAYRCLHGFTLTSQNSQGASNTDLAFPTFGAQLDPSWFTFYPPESTKKAAQLYRCIRRAYPTNGRRSPPKSALECVAAALPVAEETEKRKAIRNFVFSRLTSPTLCNEDLDSVSSKDPDSVKLLPHFPSWVLSEEDGATRETSANSAAPAAAESSTSMAAGDGALPVPVNIETVNEIPLVRKGICEELAQGALPRMGGSGGLTTETAGKEKNDKLCNEATEREATAAYEKELYEKFSSILDYLCYEPTDADSWYRAGLCLSFKADIICDRLATPRGNEKDNAICLPTSERKGEASFPLPDLRHKQIQEHKAIKAGWVALLGDDLSPYISHPWATLASLRSCSVKVKSFCRRPDCESTETEAATRSEDETAFDEIEAMYSQGDFVGWERAWGGLFVSAVADMLKKCFATAHFLSVQEKYLSNDTDELCYEVAETAATSYYAELMGGVSYGYPMQIMTESQRRNLAEESKAYFLAAIDFALTRKLEENIHDLYFMIGKCEEKIAKTLVREKFPQLTEDFASVGAEAVSREYEVALRRALQSYATAHREMKKAEHERGLQDVQQGGSSHGVAEIVYRQHACRMKALFVAVQYPKETRDAAEREALRITRAHWYSNPGEGADYDPQKDVRDSVWEVLADCISAMAQLRNDNHFFHRSVYRHAMALLWAPVLCDPETGYSEGSLGDVPATKSYHLRGLNTGEGACAKSAAAVISALFDKKRPQLCAVWVATTANPSSFEVLNDAVRKYDALRFKYINVYIDIMRICRRRDVLKTFLGWVDVSQRDLPAFYDTSAAVAGAAPDTIHSKENLLLRGSGILWTTKRRANQAIAEVLLMEMEDTHNDAVTKRIDIFKEAYSCFLRLNSPVDDKAWKSQKVEEGAVTELDVMCKAYQDLEGGQSSIEMELERSSHLTHKVKMLQLKAAVAKCEELFPALVPTRQRKRTKRQLGKATHGDTASVADGSERKDDSLSGLPSILRGEEAAPSGEGKDKSPKKKSTTSEKKEKKTKKAASAKAKSKEKTAAKKSKGTLKLSSKESSRREYITVDVPPGLKEGESFKVTLDIGEGKKKAFKLKVPSGGHKKLKFQIPSSKKQPAAGSKKAKSGKAKSAKGNK